MRYTGPKARLCRREGVNLFGSPKYQKIMGKSGNIPGMHGGKRQGKLTEYAKQLREKQKARRMYGLSEKKFKKYFDRATQKQGITGQVFMGLLERRLDNVIYRAGFAMTRMQARQFASHGLFTYNGRRVNIPSIEVKIGDVFAVRDARKGSPVFKQVREELENHVAPEWLKVDVQKLTIEVIALPDERHYETLLNPQVIVEFYSR